MKKEYGEWAVLGPSPDKKGYSRCQCSCGVIKDVNDSTLRLGKSKSCGHDSGKWDEEDMVLAWKPMPEPYVGDNNAKDD